MKKIFLFLISSLLCVASLNAQTWQIGWPEASDVEATLNGKTLTISGTGAMKDYNGFINLPWGGHIHSLTTVIIEEGVTVIGSCAFQLFMNLSDISFPKTLKSISESAFEGCAIQHLSLLGTSLEEIGKSAFQSCTQLVTVSLPASVATIGYSAFGNCPALQSIEVDAANDNYLSDDGILFNKSKTTLVSFPGAIQGVYSLPSSVEIILEKAFNGSNIHSVEIMNSNLKIISAYAFLYCKRLTSIMIPASVEIIGNYSFSHSTSLIEVVCFSSTPIPIQRNHFYNIELENCILRVPSASLQKYRQADVWKEFGSIVALDEATIEISLDKSEIYLLTCMLSSI